MLKIISFYNNNGDEREYRWNFDQIRYVFLKF